MLLVALVTMTFAFIFGAQAKGSDSPEAQALRQAVEAFIELQAPPPASDASIRWSASLRALAQSKSQIADRYLVELALFKLDGEIGSEWSCAASKRARHFSSLMRRQMLAFAQDNSCTKLASARKLDAKQLCASKKEFGRHVEQTRNVPLPDEDGACS